VRIAINLEQLFYRAPGGTGRYAARLASCLAGQFSGDVIVPFLAWHRGQDVSTVFERFGLGGSQLAPAVRIPLPRPALFQAWNTLAWPSPDLFSPAIREADIVHAPFPAVPPVKAPLVVTVHDAGPALFPSAYPRRGVRFHVKGLERAAQRARVVIADTHAAAEEIVAHSPIGKEMVRVVPLGVDHCQATPAETEEVVRRHRLDDAPYVLWVGSLEPRKNIGALIKAFVRLTGSNGVPHRLVLAGPRGWLHEGLISDLDRAVLGDRLRALGVVTQKDLRSLYAGAALFAFPSIHEGFGLPVLEAMVQGAPVVCSDIAALREVAADAALFVPPTDVDRWVDAIATVAGDSGRRSSLKAAGYHRASLFSWDKTARATHAVYEEVAREKS
jgi:glycosyltransferase involved in cell wall biosynthesis